MDEEKGHTMEEVHQLIEDIDAAMKNMRTEIDRLREENDKLMKIVMKTDDAIAIPDVTHRAYFGILQILGREYTSDERKLELLKYYLRPSIEENPRIVLSVIESIKEEHPIYSAILEEFNQWIINTFAY